MNSQSTATEELSKVVESRVLWATKPIVGVNQAAQARNGRFDSIKKARSETVGSVASENL